MNDIKYFPDLDTRIGESVSHCVFASGSRGLQVTRARLGILFHRCNVQPAVLGLSLLATFVALLLSAGPVHAESLKAAVCAGVQNSYECAQRIESAQLKKLGTIAKRNKGTLSLFLLDGKILELIDKPNEPPNRADDVVLYSFRDYIEPLKYFLIENQYYEGGSHSLISRRSGRIYAIDDIPVISPGFKRLVTLSACDAYCPNRLQVWRVAGDKLEKEFNFDLNEYWIRGTAVWLDDEAIEITKEVQDKEKSDPSRGKYVYVKKQVFARIGRNGWQITDK